jgi:hypothetical protein
MVSPVVTNRRSLRASKAEISAPRARGVAVEHGQDVALGQGVARGDLVDPLGIDAQLEIAARAVEPGQGTAEQSERGRPFDLDAVAHDELGVRQVHPGARRIGPAPAGLLDHEALGIDGHDDALELDREPGQSADRARGVPTDHGAPPI